MARPARPLMEADVEQLSHPPDGPFFRLHPAYYPQQNFNFFFMCPNSRVPHDTFGTQSSKGSSYRKKLHVVIMFLITTFGGYVQFEYQSKRKSPFDEHATIMASIFVSLCLYAVSSIAEFKLESEEPYYLPIIRSFGPLLGFFVLVLLLLILMPLLGILASILWVLFIVKASIMSFSRIVQCLHQVMSGIERYFDLNVSEPSHSLEVVV